MASSLTMTLLLLYATAALLISPTHSLNCASQKFTNGKTFATCVDLPQLSAFLHYTYDASNSSLSIGYVAAPAEPEGWVAWAINPTKEGMVGSQALLAYKEKGSLVVKTYDITSYVAPSVSKLSFDVWDLSAESVGKDYALFATMKVPEKAKTVNQVWQVGPSVGADGTPVRHAMNDGNTNSKGVLKLAAGSGKVTGGGGAAAGGPAGAAADGPGGAPAAAGPGGASSTATDASTPSTTDAATPAGAADEAGASMIGKLSLGSCMGIIVLVCSFIGL